MNLRKLALVTGGAGFIGSNLCEKLLESGMYDVISLDNYSTGSKNNHLSGVTYVEGDTQNIDKLIIKKPDIVYHLGEYSRVEQSFKDLNTVWSSNINGTFEVIKFCNKVSAKLIYAGSSTKFSDGITNDDLSPYTWTKSKNTELVQNFSKWFGLEYAITYFYNAYGPKELKCGRHATLIGIFKRLKREGKPLTVVSPGTQVRNFTHVNDIVNGIFVVGEEGFGDGYGIGSDQTYEILEIARMFDSQIEMLPERPGNRLSAQLKVEKTKALGWRTSKTLEDYIESFKSTI
jgi:UDP-glucose 4-epimerase